MTPLEELIETVGRVIAAAGDTYTDAPKVATAVAEMEEALHGLRDLLEPKP